MTITEFTRFTQFPVLVDCATLKFPAREARKSKNWVAEETSTYNWVDWVNRVKIRSGSLCVIPRTPPGRV